MKRFNHPENDSGRNEMSQYIDKDLKSTLDGESGVNGKKPCDLKKRSGWPSDIVSGKGVVVGQYTVGTPRNCVVGKLVGVGKRQRGW